MGEISRLLLLGAVIQLFSISNAYRTEALPGWRGETTRSGAKNSSELECVSQDHTEYWGDVVFWGSEHLQATAEACCDACAAHSRKGNWGPGQKECNTWVWCSNPSGCGDRKHKECWLKHQSNPSRPTVQSASDDTPWHSGVLLTAAQAEEKAKLDAAAEEERRRRREDPDNPHVFFDITIDGQAVGRIEFKLYAKDAPNAAENFRALSTGEKGTVPRGHEGAGKMYSFKGQRFYRIIDRFINQAGAGTDSVFGGSFKDDPGGLALKHDRAGLLSMANSGPDTNTSHFSIVVAAAPHLNGKYTVFGEVVAGMDVVTKINQLANKGSDRSPRGNAVIADCGQLN